MSGVGIRIVLERTQIREVDAVVLPRAEIVRRPKRQRPAEVWVTPFDEIFGAAATAANTAPVNEEHEPAITVLEPGPVIEPVRVRVAGYDAEARSPT